MSVHVDTTAHVLFAQYFYQVATSTVKIYIHLAWIGSACRYDCTFLWLQ